MDTTKKRVIIWWIALFLLVVGWFAVASLFLWWKQNTLQNSVITPPDVLEEANNQEFPSIDTSNQANNNNTAPEDRNIKNGEISLALPHFIDASAVKKLNALINEDENIDIAVSITQASSLREYRNLIASWTEEYDLVLIPSMRQWSFDQSRSFPFNQDVLAIFHPSIAEIMTQWQMKRIPVAVDPLLTISQRAIPTGSRDEFSWIDLEKALLLSPGTEEALLWFWISDIDKKLIKETNHPLPWYLDTLELILASGIQSWTNNFLFQLIETPFREIVDIIQMTASSSSKLCKANAFLCLLQEKKLFAWFGSLSEAQSSLWESDKLQFYPLPDQWGLTAQARWWVSTHEKNSEAVLAWILWYLQEAPTSNLGLWNTSLPAFNSALEQHLLESQYQHIAPFIKKNKLQITSGSLTFINDELEDWFQEVLDWDRRLDLYLEERR